LLHQAAVLQNIERFLFTLPVFGGAVVEERYAMGQAEANI
jgi:hypothetical protein